jgi:sugar diacid utilization regulator/putative methionine-R-sulfoxide reductase with GAF domain
MVVSAVASEETPGLAQLSSGELARLLELSQGLSESLDFDRVLDKVVRAARDLLGTDMSTLLLFDAERQTLVVKAFSGIDGRVARRLSTPVGQNLAGKVAANGMPLRTSDIAHDRRSGLAQVCAEGHIRSAMLVPLTRGDDVLGVLGVECTESRAFTDREEDLLQLLANHAAGAIETAHLYSIEREQVDKLRTLVQRVNSQNDSMRRSREAHDRLAEAALEGAGQQALLHILVELVPAPLVLVNQFGARLCAEARPEDSRLESLWASCSGKAAFAKHLQRLRANAGRAQPSPLPDAGFWRLVPVLAGGEVLAAIVVLDHTRLEEQHMLFVEEAASILAAELLRERSVAEAEARAHGSLVQALLSDGPSTGTVEERAALLGYDLAAEQCVVAVAPPPDGNLPEPALLTAAGRRCAARAGLRGLFGQIDGMAVVVLGSGDRTLSREAVEHWVADFEKELGTRAEMPALHFGVSEVPCDNSDVARAFAHARQAVAVCRVGEGWAVTCFDDVKLIATLIDIANEDAVQSYVEDTIGKLIEYDSRKRTDLAHTLETYLDCSGVARHAAKALFLHPHSLRYRLRRIVEIQGLDMDDPMARLSTHLALKLRQLIAAPE